MKQTTTFLCTLFLFSVGNVILAKSISFNSKLYGFEINNCIKNVKIDSIIKKDSVVEVVKKTTIKTKSYNKFFVTVNYGFAFRTASIDKNLSELEKDFQKSLKSGNSFQIKTGFKPNKNSYFGFTYSQFTSSESLNNVIFTEPTGDVGTGSINQTNTINFYGLSSGWTLSGLSKNDAFCFDLSLGYINYTEKRKLFYTYEATGGGLGISTDISYYFGVSKHFKIGPTFSYSGGALKKYEINGNNGYNETVKFDDKTFLSLYRIDLMIGTYFEF